MASRRAALGSARLHGIGLVGWLAASPSLSLSRFLVALPSAPIPLSLSLRLCSSVFIRPALSLFPPSLPVSFAHARSLSLSLSLSLSRSRSLAVSLSLSLCLSVCVSLSHSLSLSLSPSLSLSRYHCLRLGCCMAQVIEFSKDGKLIRCLPDLPETARICEC